MEGIVSSPQVKKKVLLHNGGFCNGFITKRCLHNLTNMSYDQLFSQKTKAIKNLMFLSLFFLRRKIYKYKAPFVMQPLEYLLLCSCTVKNTIEFSTYCVIATVSYFYDLQ
jgi:hypothetical protein